MIDFSDYQISNLTLSWQYESIAICNCNVKKVALNDTVIFTNITNVWKNSSSLAMY